MSRAHQTYWRFSLSALFVSVTAVAIICAVLPYPYVAFYSLLSWFFLASIAARFGPVGKRTFWFWFALYGWSYILLSTPFLEAVDSSATWDRVHQWLDRYDLGLHHWSVSHYVLFAQFTIGMCVALTGASVAAHLAARRRAKP